MNAESEVLALRWRIHFLRCEMARVVRLFEEADAGRGVSAWELADVRARMSSVDAALENAVVRCGRLVPPQDAAESGG